MVAYIANIIDPLIQLIGVVIITQLRKCVIKIVTFKGGHLKCGKSDLPYQRELLLKERIRSFKRSSHFEKGRN